MSDDRIPPPGFKWCGGCLREYRQLMWDYLECHPCADCGEADIVVLQFDHRDPEAKVDNISSMVCKGRYGQATLLSEMAKCDVVCANCHTRRTAVQQGWHVLNRAADRTRTGI